MLLPCNLIIIPLLLELSNSLLLNWVAARPSNTGANFSVNWPLAFDTIYSIAGISACNNGDISTTKNPYHDTVNAAAAQINTQNSTRTYTTSSLCIRRPDNGYIYSYMATGYKA